ncbi:cobyrinate a,c-diamide synthase [Cyanobium sp. NIES-981]|uniref:cobyrinate a,c-diamide synthase n=1 Tax=Cyanobium sp. NIES-981 TaxID=1851505 RepID=UPI0007DD774B|nr:cobyrinate a,c-diamide synthase [Cyanobium sp. NIES-981]SBO42927.1 Cobyrinic acid A,C-diamide synthase [Cyanobium sp. NIES-981]
MPCLIAAPCSGSGKTLLTLSLAALARQRGLRLQPFKVGPDYLDPQLLSQVSGLPCRNLDPILCGEAWVRRCFHWHGSRADLALVEGVMGLFDGRGPGSEGSSAAVAALLDLPVVLVVEASRQAGSLAALVRGFRDHGPPPVRLAGVVLNRVNSARHRQLLAEALEAIAVPLLGVLPSDPALDWPERHLGLLPPQEQADLPERQQAWAALAERHLDLEQLWPLLAPAAPASGPGHGDPIDWLLGSHSPSRSGHHRMGSGTGMASGSGMLSGPLPVAVAQDAAFHFRYPEADELLRGCGLDPRPWSPLADEPLPPGTRAVLLPGGYPELHAAPLAAAGRSLAALRQAARTGLPIAAECGGLLLLGETLGDPEGRTHPMAGVLPFSARRGALSLGYREALAGSDGLLVRRGESFRGHEFHRWQLQTVTDGGGLWQLEGWGSPRRSEGWTTPTLHASWLHLHWAGCPRIPSRLAAAAASAAVAPARSLPSHRVLPDGGDRQSAGA